MKILFKLASRSRPLKLFSCLENINKRVKDKDNYKILCTLDKDDIMMNNTAHINKLSEYHNTEFIFGESKSKIDAINRDMQGREFDILINTSDDMDFVVFGFDEVIRNDMAKHFPDTDGALHYNDNTKAGDHLMTMSIIGKKYYDRFGYIYHPDYTSLWSDNEATSVAKLLNKYKYLPTVLFHHNHPGWGKAQYDNQYLRTESFYNKDKEVFERRQKINFGI